MMIVPKLRELAKEERAEVTAAVKELHEMYVEMTERRIVAVKREQPEKDPRSRKPASPRDTDAMVSYSTELAGELIIILSALLETTPKPALRKRQKELLREVAQCEWNPGPIAP